MHAWPKPEQLFWQSAHVRSVYYKSVQTHELFLKKRFVYSLSLTCIVSASASLPQPRHGCLHDAVASSVLTVDGQGGEDLYAASNALDGNLSTAFVSGGVREGQVKDGLGEYGQRGKGGKSLTSKNPPSIFLAQRKKNHGFITLSLSVLTFSTFFLAYTYVRIRKLGHFPLFPMISLTTNICGSPQWTSCPFHK